MSDIIALTSLRILCEGDSNGLCVWIIRHLPHRTPLLWIHQIQIQLKHTVINAFIYKSSGATIIYNIDRSVVSMVESNDGMPVANGR